MSEKTKPTDAGVSSDPLLVPAVAIESTAVARGSPSPQGLPPQGVTDSDRSTIRDGFFNAAGPSADVTEMYRINARRRTTIEIVRTVAVVLLAAIGVLARIGLVSHATGSNAAVPASGPAPRKGSPPMSESDASSPGSTPDRGTLYGAHERGWYQHSCPDLQGCG